jgi:hypothetical protein
VVARVVGGAGGGAHDRGDVDEMNALAETFMKVMNDQPLSLALCVMNLLLLWYCFRITGQYAKARSEMAALIVQWQKESQAIMADCVSKENLQTIVGALERDRELYRAMLPVLKVESK